MLGEAADLGEDVAAVAGEGRLVGERATNRRSSAGLYAVKSIVSVPEPGLIVAAPKPSPKANVASPPPPCSVVTPPAKSWT